VLASIVAFPLPPGEVIGGSSTAPEAFFPSVCSILSYSVLIDIYKK